MAEGHTHGIDEVDQPSSRASAVRLPGLLNFIALLMLMCVAGGARADACPQTQAISVDAFMGGGFPAWRSLWVRVPASYGRVDPAGIHPARTLWTTLENAATAKRNAGMGYADFFYGAPVPEVEFDADRLAFVDGQGRFLQRILESFDGAKVDLVRARNTVILFSEMTPEGGGQTIYVAYVAMDDRAEVLRLGYRPPAGEDALGDCVWRAFRSAIADDGEAVSVYSPATAESLVSDHDDWSGDVAVCPADLIGRTAPVDPGRDTCAFTDGLACLVRCEAGEAGACYWLGRDMFVRDQPAPARILLARACRLGVVAGCTQRATELSRQKDASPELQRCAYRSVEKSCLQGDPWGCAVQGSRLSNGLGVPRDPAGARKALDRACALDPDGKACASARKARARLDTPPAP